MSIIVSLDLINYKLIVLISRLMYSNSRIVSRVMYSNSRIVSRVMYNTKLRTHNRLKVIEWKRRMILYLREK